MTNEFEIVCLIDEIIQLKEENDQLRTENESYKLWMERSITRIKEMQK